VGLPFFEGRELEAQAAALAADCSGVSWYLDAWSPCCPHPSRHGHDQATSSESSACTMVAHSTGKSSKSAVATTGTAKVTDFMDLPRAQASRRLGPAVPVPADAAGMSVEGLGAAAVQVAVAPICTGPAPRSPSPGSTLARAAASYKDPQQHLPSRTARVDTT
jgi:hypothetical protein